MERIEKGFSSLVGCYALLATLAASFLIYAQWAVMAHPTQWADLASLVSLSSLGHAFQPAQVLPAVRSAASHLRERMHATRLYFGVFAAFWLVCILWMQIGKRGRRLHRQTLWISGITLLVASAATLYGLGTRGTYLHQITPMPLSDILAAAFLLLILPLITWFRIRSGSDQGGLDGDVSARRLAGLGLGLSVVPHPEGDAPLQTKPEVRQSASSPAARVSQSDDHATIAVNRLMARAAAPVSLEPQQPVELAVSIPAAPEQVSVTPAEPVSVVPSTALTLVQAKPIAALLPEPIAADVADLETESIVFQMSGSVLETPEAVYEPLPERFAALPAEHSVIEPIAFQVSGLIDEEVDESAASEVEEEEHVTPISAVGYAVTAEHTVPEPIEFQLLTLVAEEPVTAVAEEHIAPAPAVHFLGEPVAVQAPEPMAMVAEEPVAAIPVEYVASEAAELQTLEPTAAVTAEEPVAIMVEESAALQTPELIAMVAEEPVVAVPPVATVIPSNPVTVAHLEPLHVSAATLEPILMSAEPIAASPPASVAEAAAEPVTVAQPEPVAFAPVEPIAVVPREPVSVVPPASVAVMPPKPKPVAQPEPVPATPPPAAAPAREITNHPPQDAGDEFLHGLSSLNRSWRRIETMQEEMDEWFKQRRRQALSQASTPPAMRNSSLGTNLVQEIGEKMAAIDAQWAEIRNAALGISRAVGDVPDTDENM